jgi:trehalose synthase
MGEVWLRHSQMNAELLTEPYDIVVVHDPQPAAIRSYAPAAFAGTKWVFHSHLDLSSAAPSAWALLRSHIEGYDAVVFDSESFVNADLQRRRPTIIRPAIDPLGPRNMELSAETVGTILERYGVEAERPLVCQLSPCDPASDMLGMIDVHDLLSRSHEGIQLVLIALNPPEDAASIEYFNEVVRKSMEYTNVHILRGVSEVGNVELNAFQRAADVVVQKGLRKGFGLWIADAQWKARPVVSTRDGGLGQLVIDGETGFLAGSTEEFAQRTSQLLRDRQLAERLGQAGREHISRNFLLPRFLADELRLITALSGKGRS